MAFEPNKWADGETGNTPITAAELNRIEQAGAAAATLPAALTSAQAAGTPSIRALGTTATTALAGNTPLLAVATTPPAALAATAAVGTATTAARADHVHAFPTAAQVGAAATSHSHTATLVLATAIAPGTGTTVQAILGELAARITALETAAP